MRYTSRITLYELGDLQYNPQTSKQERQETPLGSFPCNTSTPGIETQQAVFGSVERQVLIARFQRPLQVIADGAMIGQQKYKIVRHQDYRHDGVLYLEAVSAW